jgi:sulfhydrogenase subunit alpha
MTHERRLDRSLRTPGLARVEGEGGLRVRVRGGRVVEARLDIYEPPRLFEAILRGRGFEEPVDITARICGICPVAYQMSAVQALEDAAGVTVEGPLRDLRRLLYCGEWIESHALHIHLLHAPDFLGYPGVVEMARDHPAVVERGLRLKRAGNDIVALVGGREIHPINVRVGGFHRVPTRAELAPLLETLRRARDDALETVRWVASFPFPDCEREVEMVALSHPDEYPVLGRRLVSSGGLDIDVSGYEDHVVESQVPHSTALHSRLRERGTYMVGPLARYALASHLLAPVAREAARQAGLSAVCRNPFRSIIVRAVETLHACDEAVHIVEGYERPDRPAVPVHPRSGRGFGCSEAPRGLLYHAYTLAEDGTILEARIVPPTSQNQRGIEDDLRLVVESQLELDDEALTLRCEQAIRNHDPCISCATHFLTLDIERR